MRTDFLLSFLIHFVLVIVMVVSAPFKPQIRTDLGEVIKVSIASMPASQEPQTIEPAPIPQAIAADEPVTAVQDLAMVTEPKKIDKPKPKPKKKKKDKEYKPDTQKGDVDQAGTADGKKDVTENLGSGSKFGSASIDNVSFNYPYWFTQAFTKIERNWTNPVYAHQKLVCIIYFQVITSGRIIKIEIEQPSGIDTYDRACERAVKQSQPLPPLPAEFADEIIGIHLEFPYIPL